MDRERESAQALARVQLYGENLLAIPGTSARCTLFGADIKENWQDLDIALIGIPSDTGLTCRPGARYGPQAVRQQSSLIGHRNLATGMIPYELARIGDRGNVPLERHMSIEAVLHDVETFYQEACQAQVTPISIGGDHSVTYPILKALAGSRPVGVIHIDAHVDTYGPLHGSDYHHGTSFYHSILKGLIDPRRMVQIALRDSYAEFSALAPDTGITVLSMAECQRIGLSEVIAITRQVIGAEPVYVSFDIDALDPAFAPGTGTPVPGGLSTREALQLLRGLHGLDVIGGDVVEVSPPYDPSGITALAGASLLFELLCLAAEARSKRSMRSASPRT